MFDQEVLHPRVIDVSEEPGPVDDTRTHVHHFACGRAILHVDQWDAPRPPVEERYRITAAVNDPEEIQLDLHQLGIGLLAENVEGHTAVHLDKLEVVIVIGIA